MGADEVVNQQSHLGIFHNTSDKYSIYYPLASNATQRDNIIEQIESIKEYSKKKICL